MALYGVRDEPLEKLAGGLTSSEISADFYKLKPSPPRLRRYITFVTHYGRHSNFISHAFVFPGHLLKAPSCRERKTTQRCRSDLTPLSPVPVICW